MLDGTFIDIPYADRRPRKSLCLAPVGGTQSSSAGGQVLLELVPRMSNLSCSLLGARLSENDISLGKDIGRRRKCHGFDASAYDELWTKGHMSR